MSHICVPKCRIRDSRTAPSLSLSISIVKLLLGRITKKHSIFLALILVPKNTPYALLVLVKYLIRAFIPFFLNRFLTLAFGVNVSFYIFLLEKHIFYENDTKKILTIFIYYTDKNCFRHYI